MVMFRDQNVGRSHNLKMDNSSFERVEMFKHLRTTLTNKNSIQEEIKSRLKSGNACYLSGAESFVFLFAIQILKIRVYRTLILPVVLYTCETCSLTMRGNVG